MAVVLIEKVKATAPVMLTVQTERSSILKCITVVRRVRKIHAIKTDMHFFEEIATVKNYTFIMVLKFTSS